MIGIFDKNNILKTIANNTSIDSIVLQEGEQAIEILIPIPHKPIETSTEKFVFDKIIWDWVDIIPLEDKKIIQWSIVRNQRDRLLQASDWTQLPDVPLATKEAWAAYRQALRDVTLQPDPFNIIWPQPPQ